MDHIKRLTEQHGSDGIYYVVPDPNKGWDLYAYRFDELPEIDHTELWEGEVAPILALRWSHPLKVSKDRLLKELVDVPYSVPRGRVVRQGMIFKVYHGNDLISGMPGKSSIESAFSITGKCKWEQDSHERCAADNEETLRRIFRLKDRWPSTSYSG